MSSLEAVAATIDGSPDKKYLPTGEQIPYPAVQRPPGWKGGYAKSNTKFAYPVQQPDLSSIPVTTNLENVGKITRQMKAEWPEFSWQAVQGDESTRRFQKFATNISRYGYDDEGRLLALICPQQGAAVGKLGELNVEITVTGVRGWVEEKERSIAAQLGVMGQIWFSDQDKNPFFQAFYHLFDKDIDFPLSKSESIMVKTREQGNPYQPLFRNEDGLSKHYRVPEFAQHWDEAYTVTNLSVQINTILKRKPSDEGKILDKVVDDIDHGATSNVVDDFNQLVVDLFNLGSENMLQKDNVLSWNIWVADPEHCKPTEWRDHAAKWRESLDVAHHLPLLDGKTNAGSLTRRFDGTVVKHPFLHPAVIENEAALLKSFLDKHHDHDSAAKRANDPEDVFTKLHHDVLMAAGFLKKKVLRDNIQGITKPAI